LLQNASNASAHNNLGNALQAQGKLEQAVASYRRALALEPSYVDALVNLGATYRAQGELDQAVASYQQALALEPDVPVAHSNLGHALAQQGKLDDAAACLRRAIALKPDFAEAHASLGNVLRNQGRLDEAMDFIHKALVLRPEFPEAQNYLANTLLALGRPHEAEEQFRRALRLLPDSAELRFGCSQARLLLGDYDSGFELYESRLEKDALPQSAYGALQARLAQFADVPRWSGEDGLDRVLVVWTDQGLGDTLMMMRYLPMLKARGFKKLIVYCEETLVRVVRSIPEVDEVVSRNRPPPAENVDVHSPLTSLPLLFKTRVDTIPNRVPYISVPSELRQRWADRLSAVASPRVGMVWAGRRDNPKDVLRSIRLEKLSSLLKTARINFVSLQKGEEAHQIAETDLKLFDWMDECGDLMETAALTSQLDLVIGIDTAVMHLAGALGRPLWLLNRFETDWRWMLDREDSPWYPTMRIFRQSRVGEWDEVIARATSALKSHFDRER
jgi:Tfp pilus assembly protein PilF